MKKVSVAFVCDSHYVIPTAVAITSLIYNKNPDTYYDIYIIATDLSEMEIEKFYEFRGSSSDIHIVKASLEKFKDMQRYGYVPSTAYLNFDLPDLIPNKDKVLYLDGDIIIQKDLSNLFEINIDDYYAGVVKDVPLVHNDFNIKNYFNNGVMLLNLKLMRRDDASTALLNIGRSGVKLAYMDQDCFNILFNKKVKFLPIIYNCFYKTFLQKKKKYPIEYINKCFETNYSSLDNIKKDSYIIHFAGEDKPWIYFNSGFAREWDEYFKKSPFKLHKLKRKSIKLREFILLHNITNLLFWFLKYWHDHNFKYAMGKVKYYFNNKK